MIKNILIILSISTLLVASPQILLVVSDAENSTRAKLFCYEGEKQIFHSIEVNLGKKGLGWGIGQKEFATTLVQKKEGDKKAPAGVFALTHIFGYMADKNYKLPYIHANEKLICVDDSEDIDYNKIITKKDTVPKSYEEMRRDDTQYSLGIVVAHNQEGKKGMGSCIFIHVEKGKHEPSSGCTTLKYEELEKIVEWLDERKNPILIQITKEYLSEIKKLYPALKEHKED
ncbi:MAG: L,D-transpeptidase family protein [Sulfurimonadaceae bacterium]|jgi:L,D-peptidoglycan transpeptidase YkuD (ErfK/YbiS/YcfS/YnhG family)|nr:L,D-transpeptidase family protein [Sulfurimonadaceae bacterium]